MQPTFLGQCTHRLMAVAQETLHLVQAIHLLSKAIPQIITVNKATALLPYLRPASSVRHRETRESQLADTTINSPIK